jgi:hypothetical protein
MSFVPALKALALAAALTVGASAMAAPTNFSFRGTFTQDDNVQLFNFSSDGSATSYIVSYGYAGGTQADGTVIGRGGFDTILTLFTAAGTRVGFNDDGASGCFTAAAAVAPGTVNGATDPVTSRRWDTCFSALLSAGDYILAVTQYDNFSRTASLADGFVRDGQGNFTSTFSGACASIGSFCDASGNGRTNAWAYDILNVETAVGTVAAPTSLALAGLALMALGLAGRKRQA